MKSIIIGLLVLATALPAAAQEPAEIPPRPESQAEIRGCIMDLACAATWLALDVDGALDYLREPGRPRPVAPAPLPRSGIQLAAMEPGSAAPDWPVTPEQVERCLAEIACSARWLSGRIDRPQVLQRARTGRGARGTGRSLAPGGRTAAPQIRLQSLWRGRRQPRRPPGGAERLQRFLGRVPERPEAVTGSPDPPATTLVVEI